MHHSSTTECRAKPLFDPLSKRSCQRRRLMNRGGPSSRCGGPHTVPVPEGMLVFLAWLWTLCCMHSPVFLLLRPSAPFATQRNHHRSSSVNTNLPGFSGRWNLLSILSILAILAILSKPPSPTKKTTLLACRNRRLFLLHLLIPKSELSRVAVPTLHLHLHLRDLN